MKQKLEYEKIESGDDSLRYLKIEPKANLKSIIEFERKVEPKPILILQIPDKYVFHGELEEMEKYLNENGWIFLWFFVDIEDLEFQSFTLKDSQEIELKELKEQILKTIKGE